MRKQRERQQQNLPRKFPGFKPFGKTCDCEAFRLTNTRFAFTLKRHFSFAAHPITQKTEGQEHICGRTKFSERKRLAATCKMGLRLLPNRTVLLFTGARLSSLVSAASRPSPRSSSSERCAPNLNRCARRA